MSEKDQEGNLFSTEEMNNIMPNALNFSEDKPETVFGMTFRNVEERRAYFREELRKKLPELKKIEGFPIGSDEDILNLSDPPYYTACPNPWLNQFVEEWEKEKVVLEKEGKRSKDFEVKEPYAADVSEGKNNPIYMAHAYHTKVPHPAIMRYILHYTQPGDIVFDGFAGTGMTGVAAAKCSDLNEVNLYGIKGKVGKRHCMLGDLSPIASFIAYNFNNPINNESIKQIANVILEKSITQLGYLYKTEHTDGQSGVISYVIWSDVLVCGNCGKELSYWDESLDEHLNIKSPILCPNCGSVVVKNKLSVAQETVLSANGSVVSLPKKRPVLIKYEYKGKKYTKIPDEKDLETVRKIAELYPSYYFPKNKIKDGVKTGELIRCGYTDVSLLYTRRNLIIFSDLWEATKPYPILRFVLTSILVKTGSLLHNIGVKNGKINLAGALPNALFVPSALAERNIYELFKGKLLDILNMNPCNLQKCCNQIESATDLRNLPDESVDYIFTDPPFGKNLMYSELNFIHEGWLNIFTNDKEEAIENSSQNKTIQDYSELMTRSFAEYYRILKAGKWMTVEFSNTSAAVWNALQRALTKAGFVISVVRGLDKKQGSYNAQTSMTAVKQDLVISCYKNTKQIERIFLGDELQKDLWNYVEDHLAHLPIAQINGNRLTSVIERSPKILYDRFISACIERNHPVPLDAKEFQQGLRERFVERDGMFFTAVQAAEYEEKKKSAPDFVPMGIIVSDEANGIQWLKNQLRDAPKTYQEIQPEWLQAINGVRKHDILPELKDLLEENFIEMEDGKWRLPNIQDDVDKEALRAKALLREFKVYEEIASTPKGKIKEARVEALRAGFKDCYVRKDFKTIVMVGDRIPRNLRDEDDFLLQFYDNAQNKL